MEYSVSHVSAQLAGAEDGKRRRQCAAAVLALPSGCLRAGAWVRWGNLDAPASFSEPVEVVAEVPKPDSPLLPHISSELAGHPCPSSLILGASLAKGGTWE